MKLKGFLRRQSIVADRLFVEGTVVARSLRAKILVGRGVIVADTMLADYLVFTGSINAERGVGDTLIMMGDVRIGELRGRKITVEGRLRSSSIRAEKFVLRASSLTRIGFLAAKNVEIASRPPALRGKPRIHVGELQAERLRAEFLVAAKVSGGRVELGPMCSVSSLMYCRSVSMDNTVMLGAPPVRICVDHRPSMMDRS